MRAIGLRATPQTIYYTVIEKENDEYKLVTDQIIIPKALDVPQQLSYVRTTLVSILSEYQVKLAGIRITEFNSRNLNISRLNIEGVLQELLANSSVEKYFLGVLSTFGKKLGVTSKIIGQFLDSKDGSIEIVELNKLGVSWSEFKKEEKESIITAFVSVV